MTMEGILFFYAVIIFKLVFILVISDAFLYSSFKTPYKYPALGASFLDLVLAVSFNQLRNYHAGGRGKESRPRWCIESHPFCSSADYNVEKNTHGLKMRFPAVVNAMNEEYWDFEKHIGH